MTKGSWIHDYLSGHLDRCAQCRAVNPEEARIQRPAALRRTVSDATLTALCPSGRSIYRSYLSWLAESDE
jgi:hypothetical protein